MQKISSKTSSQLDANDVNKVKKNNDSVDKCGFIFLNPNLKSF